MSISGVLITGGGGFLGSHLAEYFLEKKVPVVCVDNFCTGLRDNKNYLLSRYGQSSQLTFIEADINQDWKTWSQLIPAKIVNHISHIFHFASPASPFYYQKFALETMWANSTGLYKAIEFAKTNNARVIFASTSEVYGDPAISPQPESYWGNVNTVGHRSCYDEAKRFGESLIFTHNEKFKTNHGIVRIFNTYGPRMNPNDGRVIINFLVQALRGENLTILGDGRQTRSFCFVDDLISGITKYAETSITDPMNVGNDTEFSIIELAETILKLFQEKKLQIQFYPLPSDDPKLRRPDLTKIKSQFPDWSPKIDLQNGLMEMISWLRPLDLSQFQVPGRPK